MPLADSVGSVDPVLLLVIVLLCDAVVGGWIGIRALFSAPTGALATVVDWLEAKLNRAERGATTRAVRGAIIVLVIVAAAALLGVWIHGIAGSTPSGAAIEALAVAALIVQKRAFSTARAVARGLSLRGLAGGRGPLARLLAYDIAAQDEHAIARAAIEAVARTFCVGVVAAAFWYLLLGLPGLCVYRAIDVLAARIGHATPTHAAFGGTAARLHVALTWLPGPIAGGILALAAAFVPEASVPRAFATMLRDARNRSSPAAGWTEGAVAGALGLALAGPTRIDGASVGGSWIGDGRARATAADIHRALYLASVASLIVVGLLGLLTLLRAGA